MKVVNYTDLRLNLKKLMDSVSDDMDEVIVKRKNNKDLIMISLDRYNSLNETNYLLSGNNRTSLLQAIEDVKNGKVIERGLIEL